jgi:hypothetical protein
MLHSQQRTYPDVDNYDNRHLFVSTSPSANDVSKDEKEESLDELDMPYSKFQEWALRDNLPRYVVSIPVGTPGRNKLYALWRTMSREVTELSGYPINVLQEMYTRQLKHREDSDDATALPVVTPDVLPLLDEFEFESSGGLSGRVYGIPGVADGTKIETTVVKNVQFTVPRGYVQTEDGAVAYELGTPLRDFYSLQGISGGGGGGGGGTMREISTSMAKAAAELAAKGVAVTAPPPANEDADTMLVRLGVVTAVVLGGATAVSMLSHHLTVNVFWV